jgi:hypothetical protein
MNGVVSSRPQGLFTNEVQHHPARVLDMAMFPQVNALPRAQRKASAAQRQAEVHGGERGADVCRHVVRTLAGVDKKRVAVGHEALKKNVRNRRARPGRRFLERAARRTCAGDAT